MRPNNFLIKVFFFSLVSETTHSSDSFPACLFPSFTSNQVLQNSLTTFLLYPIIFNFIALYWHLSWPIKNSYLQLDLLYIHISTRGTSNILLKLHYSAPSLKLFLPLSFSSHHEQLLLVIDQKSAALLLVCALHYNRPNLSPKPVLYFSTWIILVWPSLLIWMIMVPVVLSLLIWNLFSTQSELLGM